MAGCIQVSICKHVKNHKLAVLNQAVQEMGEIMSVPEDQCPKCDHNFHSFAPRTARSISSIRKTSILSAMFAARILS